MRPITAADLMNPKVLAVRDDLTLRELAAFLIRNQITGAPVEDGAGRLVGVVSLVDIAEAVLAALDGSERGPEDAKPELVRDMMTPEIDSVPEDATVSEVASRMLDTHAHRLLVTRESAPVGIVTASDLLGLLVDE